MDRIWKKPDIGKLANNCGPWI